MMEFDEEEALSSVNKEHEEKNQRSKYDHFDTERIIKIIPVPDEIRHSEFGKKVRRPMGVGSSRGRSKLEEILRQKLLEHKWGDVALIMEGIASDAISVQKAHTDLFWKVGNEILYNHPISIDEPDLVHRHFQATRTNGLETNPAHILYEYTLYLLVKKDFRAAQEALSFFETTLHKTSIRGWVKPDEKWYDKWSPILYGYLGMIDYIFWKEMDPESNNDFMLSEDDREDSMKKLTAEQAVSHFETLLATDGVWDIFITKYVELLEYLERVLDAEEALKSYSFKNPKNPNAHKYWYEFLCKYPDISDDNKASKIQALSNLHEVAPSDFYMLELHKLRFDTAIANTDDKERLVSMVTFAFEILMDMMDYETWIKHVTAWEALASSLQKAKNLLSNQFSKILDEIWFASKRHTWWPRYHFTSFRAKQALKLNTSLANSKFLVASLLLGIDCEFCKLISDIIS